MHSDENAADIYSCTGAHLNILNNDRIGKLLHCLNAPRSAGVKRRLHRNLFKIILFHAFAFNNNCSVEMFTALTREKKALAVNIGEDCFHNCSRRILC